jgi:hypothetical protein
MANVEGHLSLPSLLVVEGIEEARFWRAFLKHEGRNDIAVQEYGGKTQLRGRLAAIVRQPGFDRVTWLGIFQDADDDPAAALQRVQGALQRENLPIPDRAWKTVGNNRQVVAGILPDGETDGDLETLVWASIATSPLAECVDHFLGCAELARTHRNRAVSKARIHAWIAGSDRPDLKFGEAMDAALFDYQHHAFDRIRQILPDPVQT